MANKGSIKVDDLLSKDAKNQDLSSKLDQILTILQKQERRATWALVWKIIWISILVIIIVLPIYLTYELIQGIDIDSLINSMGGEELETMLNLLN